MLHEKQLLAVLMLGALAAGSAQAVDNATRIFFDNSVYTSSASDDDSSPTTTTLATLRTDLLAFEWQGVVYSTGVDDARLTSEPSPASFEDTKFRMLPLTDVPLGPANFYMGAVPRDEPAPPGQFNSATAADITELVKDGARGLDFTTGIFNLGGTLSPGVTTGEFPFGGTIKADAVGDGEPDLLFAKLGDNITATAMRLVDDAGNQLGDAVNINPGTDGGEFLGNLQVDLYNFNKTGALIDQTRAFTLFVVELSEFNLTGAELADAKGLEVDFPGRVDFAFLAANEGSIPTASGIETLQSPTGCESGDNSRLTPSPQVQVVNADGDKVEQAGIVVKAEDLDDTDSVNFSGDTEETTNANGIATFDNLIVDDCSNPGDLSTTFVITSPGFDRSELEANDDSETVQKDSGTTNLAVVDNDDFGPNGPAATAIVITSDPGNGTATVIDGGTPSNPIDDTVDYMPNAGFFGTDSFDYRIEDSTGTTSTATVTITVNDPPAITLPGTPTFDEDSSGNPIDTSIDISDGDGDTQAATITVTNGTATLGTTTNLANLSGNGSTSISFDASPLADVNAALDSLTLTPTADFDGTASIQLQTDDGNGASDDQTLNITVNDAPEVSSINRGSTPASNPTNADTVEFDVTFSETVTGVDAADFDISSTGTASTDNGNSDISVTGSGSSYTVAVANITGEGTITVNLADDDSIVSNDGNNTPLGGVGTSANGDGSRSGDQVFAIDRVAPSFTSAASTNFPENGMGMVLDIDADDGFGADTNVTYALTGGTDQGEFSINGGNGQLTFNITPDFENPTDSDTNNDYVVDVSATDSLGNTAIQSVTVNVTNVNENPVFTSATSASFAENDTGTVIDVNATDGDGGANDANVTYSLTGGVDDSLFSINTSNGVVTFNSPPDFETPTDNGTDNVYDIQVQADDSTNQATQAIAITVTDVNEAPTDITLSNNQVDQSDGTDAVVGTLDATDPDTGDTHTFSLVSGAGDGDSGSFNISGTDLRANDAGSLPAGTYNIRLEADDGNGGTFEKAFTVTVNDDVGPNAPNPPDLLAADDSGASDSDDVTNVTDPTLRVDLSGTNAEAGDTVEVLLGGAPLGTPATATLASGDITNANVDIAITDGNLGADGAKSLTARVTDTAGNVGAESAALSLVLDTNSPSLDTNSGLTVDEDASATPITNTLLASSDNQSGAASITYTVSSGPSDGSLSPASFTQQDLDNDNVTYKPDDDFAGNDSVTLDITDAAGNTLSSQTFTITINAVNDAPQVNDDTATTDEDMPVIIDVLANDSDVDGNLDPATVQVVSGPNNGATTVNATNGEITYTPDADSNGTDSFNYKVCDDGTPTPPKCSQATVSISVGSVNDLPTASDDAADVDEDDSVTIAVLANDEFGGDGAGTTAVEIIDGADNGTATVDDGGTSNDPTDDTVVYEPAEDFFGADAFDYRIADADGDAALATVQVSVKPVNDAPSITLSGNQVSDSGSGEQVVSNFATNFEPGPNESGQSIAEFIVSNGDNALFAVQPAIATDGTLSYTPNGANLEGIAEVTVQVRDDGGTDNGGQDLSQPQTFIISIGLSADVEISVTGPANAAAGSEVTYTVNVTNNGPSQAEGVVVSVDVPDSVTFVSAEPPCSSGFPCSISGLTDSSTAAAGGSLKQPGLQAIYVGEVVEFDATFSLGSNLGGNEQLFWNVTSNGGDPNPGNNEDQSILGVAAVPVPVLGRTTLLLLCLMLALSAMVATRRGSIQAG